MSKMKTVCFQVSDIKNQITSAPAVNTEEMAGTGSEICQP